MTIRAALADDQPLVRDGFRAQIALVDDIDLVAEATTGAEAVEIARSRQPDVLLMDVRMPVMDGIEATRAIRHEVPATRVVVVTGSAATADVSRARSAGASGSGASPDSIRETRSRLRIRPPTPVPSTRARSMPCSSAIRLTMGE